jgi:hypothetical protein
MSAACGWIESRMRRPALFHRLLCLLIGAVYMLWIPATSADDRTALTTDTFTVVTVNVRGLPAWLLEDDPALRLPLLLAKLAAFDVVLLQEQFVYGGLVAAQRGQFTVVEGNGGRWWRPVGDGLTLLTRLPTIGSPIYDSYRACHGWFNAASDCLADKGYLMQRLALRTGGTIDVWNTHLDAGSDERDRAVRATQLEHLAAAIEANSPKEAVIVGGDFNLDWNTPHDRQLLERWSERLGLVLAALTPTDARPRRVDYLFYRNGPATTLAPRVHGVVEQLTDPQGKPLSNHPALFTTFALF